MKITLLMRILMFFTVLFCFIGVVNSGQVEHTIYTPYGTVLYQPPTATYDSDIRDEPTQAVVTTRFSELSEFYEPNSLSLAPEPFCKLGGWYTINVKNDPSPGASPVDHTFQLFYCKTQADLLSMMKIPSTWQNAKLDLYCNDGQLINMPTINKDILTLELATFRGCILKNRNLEDFNTIIYGFEGGNKVIDSDEKYYFDSTDRSNPIVNIIRASFEDVTETNYVASPPGLTLNADGKTFYFNHDGGVHNFYTLKDTASALTVPITDVFDLNEAAGFDLSRVALFRTLGEGKKIYGFETPQSLIVTGSENIDPVYRIQTEGFVIPIQTCQDTLASYGTVSGNTVSQTSEVVCRNDGEIIINGRNIDLEYGEYTALNLFKNVILSINTGLDSIDLGVPDETEEPVDEQPTDDGKDFDIIDPENPNIEIEDINIGLS